MKIEKVKKVFLPIVGSAIAIGYGGSAVAFSTIAAWPPISAGLFGTIIFAWIFELVLGVVLFVSGFGTLLQSERARRSVFYALILAAVYELLRGTTVFRTFLSLPGSELSLLIPVALVVAAWAIAQPSSKQYTSRATADHP